VSSSINKKSQFNGALQTNQNLKNSLVFYANAVVDPRIWFEGDLITNIYIQHCGTGTERKLGQGETD
jgi:hypothetical protein